MRNAPLLAAGTSRVVKASNQPKKQKVCRVTLVGYGKRKPASVLFLAMKFSFFDDDRLVLVEASS